MTRLGLEASLPSALRLACHRFFMARPASRMASEEPTQAVPTLSRPCASAWNRFASMATHLQPQQGGRLDLRALSYSQHLQPVGGILSRVEGASGISSTCSPAGSS